MNISPDMPPRHADGQLCMVACITMQCPMNHRYHDGALTPNEERWLAVEIMLQELVAFDPTSGKRVAGDSYQVDEAGYTKDGLVAVIFGTAVDTAGHMAPYIIGEV